MPTLTVYQTDPAGVFVGPVEADPSPLEEGVWLIPAGCVMEAPPTPDEGEQARWTGSAWVVEPATPTRWRVMKMTLINRMTDAEVEAIETAIATLPAKKRERWRAARWLWSDDADVLAVAAALQWEPERIAALLAVDHDPELALLPAGAD